MSRLYSPRWVSHLYALQPARSAAEWEEFFAWASETGFNGVRVFCGFLGQVEQTPEQARARLPEYLRLATDYGLAVELCALNGTADYGYDWAKHVEEISAMAEGMPNVVVEIANEIGHGSQALSMTDCRILVDIPRQRGLLATLGAPVGQDEPFTLPNGHVYWPAFGGDYNVAHRERDARRRRVREMFAVVELTGQPCISNEDIGADDEDPAITRRQRVRDPYWFWVLGLLEEAFPGVGRVHHAQHGLHAVLPGPIQQACADARLNAADLVRSFFGEDLPRYRNTGFHDSPVGEVDQEMWERCFTPTDGRHYSFIVGNRGLSIAVDHVNQEGYTPPWANGWVPTLLESRDSAEGTHRTTVWVVRR